MESFGMERHSSCASTSSSDGVNDDADFFGRNTTPFEVQVDNGDVLYHSAAPQLRLPSSFIVPAFRKVSNLNANMAPPPSPLFQCASHASPPPGEEQDEEDECESEKSFELVSSTDGNTEDEKGSSAPDTASAPDRRCAMDSSTEVLHQYIPPTFSRLPPDGDEFPNSWNDETTLKKPSQYETQSRKLYRSELNLGSESSTGAEPPPLPTTGPPVEDLPPLPNTMPPLPPKPLATRQNSIDDKRKMFEKPSLGYRSSSGGSSGGSSPTTTPRGSLTGAPEPSKRSVKDKIAMFSNGRDIPDAPPTITSSLKKGSPNGSLSRSSDNILQGLSMTMISQENGNGTYRGSLSKINVVSGGGAPPPNQNRKSSVDLPPHNFNQKPSPFYGGVGGGSSTLGRGVKYPNENNNGSHAPSTTTSTSLYERSQSLIDVAAPIPHFRNSYQPESSSRYNTASRTTPPAAAVGASLAANSIMEQRRKGLSKLRGLVIPDTTPSSASVVDLPTIISKDALLLTRPPPPAALQNGGGPLSRMNISRSESLEGISSSDDNSSLTTLSAKATPPPPTTEWTASSVMPKYSPAFKRRSLTAYQATSKTAAILAPQPFKPPQATPITPEPKSLESLTSPRSDSSFEYNKNNGVVPPQPLKRTQAPSQAPPPPPTVGVAEEKKNKGKLDDSDNDSAVSSSRSSISHGLSPPNSPTPGESSTTPDPKKAGEGPGDEREEGQEGEDWRILKPQSVEAINRKNVLTSAKYSTGGPAPGGGDDSSVSSSNGKHRRSDDEEASYADAETEDTESSCSELDTGKTRRRLIAVGRVNLHRSGRGGDTEEEDYEELEEIPAHLKPTGELGGEDPLQAIYDMEVKMAYINEVCDALPTRGGGGGGGESASRYFSRRDSEATVIEAPPKRKLSVDLVDGDRRARNRSSSGNESDFSSSISARSTLSRSSREREAPKAAAATAAEGDRWSMLEKKYSRSMTSVNLVAGKGETVTLTPATSVPKIVTAASDVVEKKIEKIIEKAVDSPGKKLTSANIPRGRNDFKSLAEKWQQIGNASPPQPPPPVGPKPSLSRQNSTSSACTVICATTKSPPETPASPETVPKTTPPSTPARPAVGPKPTALECLEADTAWAEKRRAAANPKRSVSVNDIRRAFEKAETQVYGGSGEASTPTSPPGGMVKGGKEPTTLTLPNSTSAHFRVSSFDSTTSEESSATTPAGIYGSVNSLVSSAPRDPYGSITSLASSTSLISPQELQQLIDEANQSLEEAGTPSHEVSVVILHREFVGGSLGITLAGGADYETKEITVHKVISGSIADRDARVHRGDRVLSINGKSTKGLTHREALNLLKAPRTEVVLVVSRGRSNSSGGFKTIDETSITLDRAVEPLVSGSLSSLLEQDDDIIYKWGPLRTAALNKDGAGLGFSLEGGKGSIQGDRPLTVKKIFIGGPAEKCGDMKVGDLIVSINGVSMSTKSRTEAWNFMKKLSDGEVRLGIRSPLV